MEFLGPLWPKEDFVMSQRLIFCNVPVEGAHNEAALEFYGRLLGRKLVRSLSTEKEHARYHAPASHGVQLSIGPKHNPHETVTCYFAVSDLKASIKELEAVKGKLVVGNIRLPSLGGGGGGGAAACANSRFFDVVDPALGEAAIMRDPAGNLVGLIQLHPNAEAWFQGDVTLAEIDSHSHGAAIAEEVFS